MPNRFDWRHWLQPALGVLFSGLAIAWAVQALDWSEVGRSLQQAEWGWLGLACLSVLFTATLRTWRWQALFQTPPPGWPLFQALIIGQAVNYFAPARLGDVLRLVLSGRQTGLSKAQVLSTIAVEKLWDIALLLVVSLVVGWFFPLPPWLLEPVRGLLLLAAVAILLVVLLGQQRRRLFAYLDRWGRRWLPRWHSRVNDIIVNGLNGLGGLHEPRLILSATIWSVLVWLSGGLTNFLVFGALGLPWSVTAAFLLLVVLQVGVAVPSLPGRVGIFQGICVVVLALFGVSEGAAFSYGLLLHVVAFGPPMLVAGLVWLGLRNDRPSLATSLDKEIR